MCLTKHDQAFLEFLYLTGYLIVETGKLIYYLNPGCKKGLAILSGTVIMTVIIVGLYFGISKIEQSNDIAQSLILTSLKRLKTYRSSKDGDVDNAVLFQVPPRQEDQDSRLCNYLTTCMN